MTLTLQGKLFAEYPDVVSVKQMCIMLGGISRKQLTNCWGTVKFTI